MDEQRFIERIEVQLVGFALRGVEHHLRLEQRDEIDDVVTQLQRLLLDALKVEQVVQERSEPARFRADHLEVTARLFGWHVPFEHERREAEHAREWRAQLVRDVADELTFHALALDRA